MTLKHDQINALLADAAREARRRKKTAKQVSYATPDGIVRFVRDVLHAHPTAYQERILRAFVEYHRVAMRAPHGAGKTALAAWVVLWGMYAFDTDVKIPTTASAWRQLQYYLWPEIHKWTRKSSIDPMPRVLDLALKDVGKEAFAVTSDTPALIEGAHASILIYVFDEAKAIPSDMWDAAEGAFSGAGGQTGAQAYALAISTPGVASGRFYDIHSRRPGYEDWHVEHISLDEAIAAGRMSQSWADQRKKQWGEHSAVYQNRVLGEFADSSEDSVIPLSWVELANGRWHERQGKGAGNISWGVDPARYGEDQTTICRLVGRVCERIYRYSQQSTMETTGRVVTHVQSKDAPIAVDVIGLGAGVYDRLKELGFKNALGVNVSQTARDERGKPLKDKSGTLTFFNLRSAVWWMLREALDPENPEPLALPPDDTLTGDLTAPTYAYLSNGAIKVESKDDIRGRIGRSTDDADSLGLAVYAARPRRRTLTATTQRYI